MDKFMASFEKKLRPLAVRLDRNIYLSAIKNSFMAAMPLLIAGSLFVLLANLPVQAYTDFMQATFGDTWQNIFSVCNDISMGMMTVYIIIGISKDLSQSYDLSDDIAVIFGSIAAFFMVTPMSPFVDGDLGMGIPLSNLGASGLFTGMIVAIVAVEILRFCEKKNITIKMPDVVPPNVAKSFSSLVPIIIVIVIFNFVRLGFAATSFGSLQNFISQFLQAPLTALGASLPAMLIALLVETVLWAFGINGGNIVGGVMQPIWLTLTAENAQAFSSGDALPNIINFQFYSNFVKLGGSGATMGLCLLLLFVARSQQFKAIGKISVVPQLFNINEPVIFGMPIVMNPLLIIPFILTPIILAVVAYLSFAIGLVPIANGVNIPWTTPPIISGFLVSGWRGALLNIIQVFISMGIFYPFFKTADNMALAREAEVKKG